MPSFFDRRASDRDLRVLLVSDVHCSLTNVHRLAELLTERAQYVDMIWLAGDVIKLTPEDRRVRPLSLSGCTCWAFFLFPSAFFLFPSAPYF